MHTRYRSSREVVADIKRVLAAKYSPRESPLDQVVDILQESRQYGWVGIYLAVAEDSAPNVATGTEELPKASVMTAPIHLVTRTLGKVEARSERANAFTGDDHALLKETAALLARFLSGKGKYLMRRAREAANAAANEAPGRRGPSGEKSAQASSRRAVAGETSGQ